MYVTTQSAQAESDWDCVGKWTQSAQSMVNVVMLTTMTTPYDNALSLRISGSPTTVCSLPSAGGRLSNQGE